MARSRTERTRELVEEVLESLPSLTEDVIHDVFWAIENNRAWCDEYDDLCKEFEGAKQSGQHSLNQNIPGRVRRITDRMVRSVGNRSPKSTLIKTYSKLVER